MNELLFLATIIINFIGIIIAYKIFGKKGLFAWIAFATVSANIEVIKCVDVFGLSVTLGNVIYGTIFLATDILSEIYGGKEARKGVWIGFYAMIVFTIISQINLLYIPNENDFASEALKTIFGLTPRICFASLLTYIISNNLDTYIYAFIKNKLPSDKWLWLRNNGSTLMSQLLDSFLFTMIAFAGVFEFPELIELSLTTYAIKFIVALCDTPFLYIAKKIKGAKNE